MNIKKMLDLGTSFFTSIEKSPKTIAIAEIDNEINYEEWFEEVDKLCGGLKSVGLRSKDKVITLLQNNISVGAQARRLRLPKLLFKIPLRRRCPTLLEPFRGCGGRSPGTGRRVDRGGAWFQSCLFFSHRLFFSHN